MGRLTYVVESAAPASSAVAPVNLAFAAAAAARASWASPKDRGDDIWDLGSFGDGEVNGGGINDFTAALRADSYSGLSSRQASMTASRISRGTVVVPFAAEVAGIHDVPRNSVLFRAHADEQPMVSSLPPVEPMAPSALEVAGILQDRHVRANGPLPGHLAFSLRRKPQRSQSFTHGLDEGSDDGTPRSSLLGNMMRDGQDIGPQRDSGSEVAVDEVFRVAGSGDLPGANDADDDEERDGCLVLPVLRNLLELQDDAPRPLRSSGTFGAHGQGHGTGGSNSGAVSRQPSQHSLRASPSVAFSNGLSRQPSSAYGPGNTSIARQNSMVSPARRRVAFPSAAPVEPNRLYRQGGSRLPAPTCAVDDEGHQGPDLEAPTRTHSYGVSNLGSPGARGTRITARATTTGTLSWAAASTPPASSAGPAASTSSSGQHGVQQQGMQQQGMQQYGMQQQGMQQQGMQQQGMQQHGVASSPTARPVQLGGTPASRAAPVKQSQPRPTSNPLLSWTNKLGKGNWLWAGSPGSPPEVGSPVGPGPASTDAQGQGGGNFSRRSSQTGGLGREPPTSLPPIEYLAGRRKLGGGGGSGNSYGGEPQSPGAVPPGKVRR